MRRPALAPLALSLLALLFGWETRQALRETPRGQDNAATAPTGAWQPGVSSPDPQPPPDPAPVSAAVAARPLFRQDRQPFRETASAPARNYETELSRFTLLGVLGFGDGPVGVVTGKTGNKTDRWELKAGDALPGFTVKEVGIDGLRLTADGQEFLLPLYAGAPTAAARRAPDRDDASGATNPTAAPGIPGSAKPAVSGAPPGPASSTAPAPAQPRTIPSPAQPRPGPEYTPPERAAPVRPPRFIPGRR